MKAQASLEAIIALVAFCVMLCLLLSTATTTLQKTKTITVLINSKAEAEKCSLLLNAMYSNSGSIAKKTIKCSPLENNKVIAMNKTVSRTIAKMHLTVRNGKKILVVENEPHYIS